MDKKGLTPAELVISVTFIAIFVGILFSIYLKLERKANMVKAKYDLINLNLLVKYFYIKNKRYPVNLFELKEKGYFYIQKTPIISNKSKFKGKILYDPFGNPYIYDNKSGKVYFSPETKKIFLK